MEEGVVSVSQASTGKARASNPTTSQTSAETTQMEGTWREERGGGGEGVRSKKGVNEWKKEEGVRSKKGVNE